MFATRQFAFIPILVSMNVEPYSILLVNLVIHSLLNRFS